MLEVSAFSRGERICKAETWKESFADIMKGWVLLCCENVLWLYKAATQINLKIGSLTVLFWIE